MGFFYALDKLNLQPLKYVSILIVMILSFYAVNSMQNLRKYLNTNPMLMKTYTYLKKNTPGDALLFSVWTYSTGYHSERRCTWPELGAPNSPMALYFEKNPEKFYEICKKKKIEYVLVDYSMVGEPTSTSYPPYFVKCIDYLVRRKKASLFFPLNADYYRSIITKPANTLTIAERNAYNEYISQKNPPFVNSREVGPQPRYSVYKIHVRAEK